MAGAVLEERMHFPFTEKEVDMKTLLLVATLTLAVYVSTTAAQNPTGPQDANGMMAMMKDCPMAIEGTKVTAEDTAKGVALTVTTKTGNVTELRERVQRMLGMHGIAATTEAITGGAKVILTPKDPAQLTEFRKQVRDHVDHMTKNGACQQMHEMMQGMKGMMGGMGGMKLPATKTEPKKEGEVDHNAHHPEAK
jgi:hypothetical protein